MTSEPDDMIDAPVSPKVDLALCVGPLSAGRFRAVLRYLCVGLLDVSARVRLVSSSSEAESLMLGSVQHVYYQEPVWPLRRRRINALLDALAGRPPNIAHGLGARSFVIADAIARRFDSHLILHAVALDEVELLDMPGGHPVEHVVAFSRPIFDAIVEKATMDPSRISLIRPGLIAGDGPTCFGRPSRMPTILCTSHLNPGNGVEMLLEALRVVRSRGHEFLAFLTGSGPLEDTLRGMARKFGLASVVTFADPMGDARQIMAGADIFIRPAVEHTVSVRTLQAMGSGMAVVTVAGGSADAYLPDVTALVCPDNHPTALAAAIERLLGDHTFARSMATQAVQHIKRNHSVSAMSDALVHLYEDLALRDQTLPVRG